MDEKQLLEIVEQYERKERLRPRRAATAAVTSYAEDDADGDDAEGTHRSAAGTASGGRQKRKSESNGDPRSRSRASKKPMTSKSAQNSDRSRQDRFSSPKRGERSSTRVRAIVDRQEKEREEQAERRRQETERNARRKAERAKASSSHKRKKPSTADQDHASVAAAAFDAALDSDSDGAEDTPLARLRRDWKFASFCQFCRLFARELKLQKFSAEKLEDAILSPMDHLVFLSELVYKLVRDRVDEQYSSIDEHKWLVELPKRLKTPWFRDLPDFDNPLIVPAPQQEQQEEEEEEEGEDGEEGAMAMEVDAREGTEAGGSSAQPEADEGTAPNGDGAVGVANGHEPPTPGPSNGGVALGMLSQGRGGGVPRTALSSGGGGPGGAKGGRELTFIEVSSDARLAILYALCEWRIHECWQVRDAVDRTVKNVDYSADALRQEPLGIDSKGHRYFYFSYGGEDCRLYKETPRVPLTMRNWNKARASWRTQCVTLDELKAFADRFRGAKAGVDRELHAVLTEEVIPGLEETINARRRQEEKQRLYELAIKKRSSRIANIAVQKEEDEKKKEEERQRVELLRIEREKQKQERERERRAEERRLLLEAARAKQLERELLQRIEAGVAREGRLLVKQGLSLLLRDDPRQWGDTWAAFEDSGISWRGKRKRSSARGADRLERGWHWQETPHFSCRNGGRDTREDVTMVTSPRHRTPYRHKNAVALLSFRKAVVDRETKQMPSLRDDRAVKLSVRPTTDKGNPNLVSLRLMFHFTRTHTRFEDVYAEGVKQGFWV